MTPNLAIAKKADISRLPQEALKVLELLEQIDNHTANLRNKLMAELKSNNETVKIKLEDF